MWRRDFMGAQPGRDWSSRRRKFGEHAIAAGVQHPPIVTGDDHLHHLALLGEVVYRPALVLGDEAAEPDAAGVRKTGFAKDGQVTHS
jgi:hypothetical protein